jgi:hypothetical protein
MFLLNDVGNMQLLEGVRNLLKGNRVPAFGESLLCISGWCTFDQQCVTPHVQLALSSASASYSCPA